MFDKIVAPNGKEYKVAVGSLSNLRIIKQLSPKMEEFTIDTMLEMPSVIDAILGDGVYAEVFGKDDDCVSVMKFTTDLIMLITEGFKHKFGEYKSENLNEPIDTPTADNGQVQP